MTGAPVRARPAPWAEAVLHAYVRHSARRQFHGWHVAVEDRAAIADRALPVLFLPNHTSWWDGFAAFELAAWLDRRFYVMMQADQLRQARFFARGGAFSIERDAPRQALDDLRYAATLLTPGVGMWVFPQGRRMPAGAPIVPEGGLTRLVAWAGPVRLVPVALRYAFVSEEHPELFARLGRSWVAEPGSVPKALLSRVAESMTAVRDRLDADLAITERAGYETFLAGAPSTNKRFESTLARLGLADPAATRNG